MLDLNFLREVENLHAQGRAFCIATIVDGRGSIPQVVGARALITRTGLHQGTIGGGRIEARVVETATGLLDGDDSSPTHFVRWNIQKDTGMTCGGEVAIYFEVYGPRTDWSVTIFGAGHVAQTLCRLLAELDCRVTCIDTRREWLDRLDAGAGLETRLVAEYADGIEDVGPESYVIVMTRGHETDVPIPKALHVAARMPAYL